MLFLSKIISRYPPPFLVILQDGVVTFVHITEEH